MPENSVYATTIVWPNVFGSGSATTAQTAILDSTTKNKDLHGAHPPFRLTDIPVTE